MKKSLHIVCFFLVVLAGCGRDRPVSSGVKKTASIPTTNTFQNSATYTNNPQTYLPSNVTFNAPIPPPFPGSNYTPFISTSTTGVYNGQDGDRCRAYGDSLNRARQAGRLNWAKRCYPQWMNWYDIAASTADRQRNPMPLYVTFGRVGENGQPSNPHNYIAPTDANAACNLPEGYILVGLCAPTN